MKKETNINEMRKNYKKIMKFIMTMSYFILKCFAVVRRETLRLSRDGNFSFSYGCFTVQNSIFQYIVMYIKHLVTIIKYNRSSHL